MKEALITLFCIKVFFFLNYLFVIQLKVSPCLAFRIGTVHWLELAVTKNITEIRNLATSLTSMNQHCTAESVKLLALDTGYGLLSYAHNLKSPGVCRSDFFPSVC